MARQRNPRGSAIRCECGARVAKRVGDDVQVFVKDFDLPWLTCPRCRKSFRLAHLEALTEQRRENGWAQ